jgi:hypothetical protein
MGGNWMLPFASALNLLALPALCSPSALPHICRIKLIVNAAVVVSSPRSALINAASVAVNPRH